MNNKSTMKATHESSIYKLKNYIVLNLYLINLNLNYTKFLYNMKN